MPFRDAQTHLQDILDSIALIESFIEGIDIERYRQDPKTRSAVERQLQIITEAAYRLGSEADVVCPGPNWKGLMGMGNILRHAYHRVDDQVVWDTVVEDLPSLRKSVLDALGSQPSSISRS